MNLFMEFLIYLEIVFNDFISFINNIDYNDIR